VLDRQQGTETIVRRQHCYAEVWPG